MIILNNYLLKNKIKKGVLYLKHNTLNIVDSLNVIYSIFKDIKYFSFILEITMFETNMGTYNIDICNIDPNIFNIIKKSKLKELEILRSNNIDFNTIKISDIKNNLLLSLLYIYLYLKLNNINDVTTLDNRSKEYLNVTTLKTNIDYYIMHCKKIYSKLLENDLENIKFVNKKYEITKNGLVDNGIPF